eukprot:10807596-Karenia_brevis.AAC.1
MSTWWKCRACGYLSPWKQWHCSACHSQFVLAAHKKDSSSLGWQNYSTAKSTGAMTEAAVKEEQVIKPTQHVQPQAPLKKEE